VAPLSGRYSAPFTGSLIATKRVVMTALGADDSDDADLRAIA
jgi:hypothetical protein